MAGVAKRELSRGVSLCDLLGFSENPTVTQRHKIERFV